MTLRGPADPHGIRGTAGEQEAGPLVPEAERWSQAPGRGLLRGCLRPSAQEKSIGLPFCSYHFMEQDRLGLASRREIPEIFPNG